MKIRTFKEKMQEVYITNNKYRKHVGGRFTFKTLDDINNALNNKLVILKAHPNDVNAVNNISSLKHLFVINEVRQISSQGIITPVYSITPVFKQLWRIDENIPTAIPYYNAVVLTNDILNESWFIGSLKHNSQAGLFDHYGVVYDINKRNAIRQLNEILICCSTVTRTRHLLLCCIQESEIETLPTKECLFKTNNKDVVITDNGFMMFSSFKVLELTSRTNNINSFLYKNYM